MRVKLPSLRSFLSQILHSMSLGIFTKLLFWYIVFSSARISQMQKNKTEPPRDCDLDPRTAFDSYKTVEDYDRCAPYLLPDYARVYYQAASGRQFTIQENKDAYKRIRILPKLLRDVSNVDLTVTLLQHQISMPIGADPLALQRLASDLGEIDTARAICKANSIMILSCVSSTLIEDVGKASPCVKWMQTYIFPNQTQTIDVIKRAEAAGFQAIVVTIDAPIPGPLPNDARGIRDNPKHVRPVNLFVELYESPSLTFKDLAWLKSQTRLPVVAKGILRPEDAIQAVLHGASAILVSNHGGRQLDYDPATIDVLPKISAVLKKAFPSVEVYVDGGVRNGFDVFKALARGARAVFIGRPIIWGLATKGEHGVSKVFEILRTELQQTMALAGTANLGAIERNMVFEAPLYTYLGNPNGEV